MFLRIYVFLGIYIYTKSNYLQIFSHKHPNCLIVLIVVIQALDKFSLSFPLLIPDLLLVFHVSHQTGTVLLWYKIKYIKVFGRYGCFPVGGGDIEFCICLIHLSCYNKILQTSWFIKNRHLFLRVLEARNSKIKTLADPESGEDPLICSQMASFLTSGQGQGIFLESHSCGLYPHDLITSQRSYCLIPFRGQDFKI